MDETAPGTSVDVEPFAREARSFVEGSRDAEDFVQSWVRLVGLDVLLPGETWTFINEIFYAVEEHVGDRESRERTGGLDDDDLRRAVAAQLPALEEEMAALRAREVGREPAPPEPASDSGAELLGLVRELLAGARAAPEFAETYTDRLERSRELLAPRVRASAEAVGLAAQHFRPGDARLRLYDIDETVLRARVAAVEPRLTAAVGTLR